MIGVIIPVVNLWDKFTKPCLDSLKSKHNLRTVIVDNGSFDNTEEECMKLVTDNFHYKKNNDNLGVSAAWNYGIRDCFINHQCDYVFVINNDVLFSPNALDVLIERMQRAEKEDPTIVMVTCMNIYGELRDSPLDILTYDGMKKKEVEESEHPDFSAFLINKKCIEEAGEADEGFKAYYEDSDWHRRIKLAGMKAIKVPTASYVHFGSRTQSQAINRPLVDSPTSHKYFVEKWGGDPEADGSLVERLWLHPFNDEKKSIKWTKQSGVDN